MKQYTIQYVHKIGGLQPTLHTYTIPDNAFSNRNTLAAALRRVGALSPGVSLREMRVEADRVCAFPRGFYVAGIPHCLIIRAGGDNA